MRTCCKLTVKTCYPRACSVVSTSCNKSENDLAIATDFNSDFKIDKFVAGIKYQTCDMFVAFLGCFGHYICKNICLSLLCSWEETYFL